MAVIGILVMIVGVIGTLLLFTGISLPFLPAIADLPIPQWGWIAMAVVGLVLWQLGRRPSD